MLNLPKHSICTLIFFRPDHSLRQEDRCQQDSRLCDTAFQKILLPDRKSCPCLRGETDHPLIFHLYSHCFSPFTFLHHSNYPARSTDQTVCFDTSFFMINPHNGLHNITIISMLCKVIYVPCPSFTIHAAVRLHCDLSLLPTGCYTG